MCILFNYFTCIMSKLAIVLCTCVVLLCIIMLYTWIPGPLLLRTLMPYVVFLPFLHVSFETRVFMFTYSLCTLYAFAHGGMIDKKGYYFHVWKLCAVESLFFSLWTWNINTLGILHTQGTLRTRKSQGHVLHERLKVTQRM